MWVEIPKASTVIRQLPDKFLDMHSCHLKIISYQEAGKHVFQHRLQFSSYVESKKVLQANSAFTCK